MPGFDEHQAALNDEESAGQRPASRRRQVEQKEAAMTMKAWEKEVLSAPPALRTGCRRLKRKLRLAAGLTALREEGRPVGSGNWRGELA